MCIRDRAPATAYTDKLTKKLIQPVTTMQIYWGAIPFVIIQIIMVGAIIAFPAIVSSGLDKKEVYDMKKVEAEMNANMDAATKAELPAPEVQPGASAAADAPAAAGAPPADTEADEDPMKALQDALGTKKK